MMKDDDYNSEYWWSFVFRKAGERDDEVDDDVISSPIRGDDNYCAEEEEVEAIKDIN